VFGRRVPNTHGTPRVLKCAGAQYISTILLIGSVFSAKFKGYPNKQIA
jgi:hypothetical protein